MRGVFCSGNLVPIKLNAMKKVSFPLITLLGISLLLGSCKKEEQPEEQQPTTTAPSSAPPAINIVDADGALTACRSVTRSPSYTGGASYDINFGLAVGAFLKNQNPNEFVPAGAVSCKSTALTKQSNNSYVYTPPTSNPTGIDFDNGTSTDVDVDWTVSGSTDVPAFTGNFNGKFPTNPKWTKVNVKVGAAITVSLDQQISGADSVIVTLASSGGGSVSKMFPGNLSSFAFTEAEGKKLSKGENSLVQIAPWSYKLAPVEGKKIYFVNETVLSVFTTFE